MRIALLSIHYPPLRSSCAVQMRDLAQELLRLGHEPIMIVPTEGDRITETIDGVQLYRLPAPKIIDTGNIRRGLSEVLLPFFMLYGLRRSNFPSRELDAVIWYSPTIFFGPVVHFLKRMSGCPAYLILRDIFPEWALDLGIIKKGPIYYMFKLVSIYQYSVANIIGVQSSSNLGYLKKWSMFPGRKLEVLNNWLSSANEKRTKISLVDTALKGRKVFVYIGNMGVAQGMDVLIDLAESLKDRQDIGFLFVGRGSEVENLKKYSSGKNLTNFLFYDEIASEEIPSLLRICHVGLISLDPRHKTHNIPGKFLTYMQAALPVLAKVNAGTDLVNIIQDNRVGYVYTDNEIDDFRSLAEDIVDNKVNFQSMSVQARSLSYRMFSSNRAAKQITSSFYRV